MYHKLKNFKLLAVLAGLMLLAACGLSTEESRQLWIKFDDAQKAYKASGKAVMAIVVPSDSCQVWFNLDPRDVRIPEDGIVKLVLDASPEGTQYSFRTVCNAEMADSSGVFTPGKYWGIQYSLSGNGSFHMDGQLNNSDTSEIFEKRDWFMWTLDILEDK